MMCKLKGWMDMGGHYLEIKGWMQKGDGYGRAL